MEKELQVTIQNNASDSDERYKRLEDELKQEREVSRKEIYLKTIHIQEITIKLTNNEQEIKRLRHEIDTLEAQLRAQQPATHSSSLIFKPKSSLDVQQLHVSTEKQSKFLYFGVMYLN